jgi:hypothetical protein
MNARSVNSFVFATVAAATLVCGPRTAQALTMSVQVLGISQVPQYTSRVKLGHMVNARSYMISVAVGGTLRVSCPSMYTGTIEAQNSKSQTGWPPNVLSVEVPPGWLPAERELPGFNNVPGGTSLICSYFWTASAKEAMYSLGAGGSTMPIGGDAYTESDSVTFEMYKPGGNGNGTDDNGCIR